MLCHRLEGMDAAWVAVVQSLWEEPSKTSVMKQCGLACIESVLLTGGLVGGGVRHIRDVVASFGILIVEKGRCVSPSHSHRLHGCVTRLYFVFDVGQVLVGSPRLWIWALLAAMTLACGV